MTYIKENLETPMKGEYDLIVAGGGVAGVCAAVAAKRAGIEKVLLLEKTVVLGGLATQGLIALYEPLCDGYGKKITYGMAAELMKLATKYSPHDLDEIWWNDPDNVDSEERYKAYFSPWIFALVLDELLEKEEVDLLLDISVVSTLMEGDKCKGLVTESKEGRGFFKAKAFIDATGDASLFHDAGYPCVDGENFMTYIAYRSDLKSMERAGETKNLLDSSSWYKFGAGPRGNGHPEGLGLYKGLSAKEITEFVLEGRKMLLADLKNDYLFSRDIVSIPTMPQFRTIRRIAGHYTIGEEDQNKRQADSIGIVADFSQRGVWYEIPYRSLIDGISNMWTAGRSIAAKDWAWTAVRVIPGVALSGEVAGISAFLSLKHGYTAQEMPYALISKELNRLGYKIHL